MALRFWDFDQNLFCWQCILEGRLSKTKLEVDFNDLTVIESCQKEFMHYRIIRGEKV